MTPSISCTLFLTFTVRLSPTHKHSAAHTLARKIRHNTHAHFTPLSKTVAVRCSDTVSILQGPLVFIPVRCLIAHRCGRQRVKLSHHHCVSEAESLIERYCLMLHGLALKSWKYLLVSRQDCRGLSYQLLQWFRFTCLCT